MGDANAEDVVQDALEDAFLAEARRPAGVNLLAWLYRFVENHAVTHHRRVAREARRARTLSNTPSLVMSQPPECPEAVTLGSQARAALLALPEEDQRVVRLFDLEGRSIDEVAEAMQLSVSATWSRLQRARAKLASALEPHVRRFHAPGAGLPSVELAPPRRLARLWGFLGSWLTGALRRLGL